MAMIDARSGPVWQLVRDKIHGNYPEDEAHRGVQYNAANYTSADIDDASDDAPHCVPPFLP